MKTTRTAGTILFTLTAVGLAGGQSLPAGYTLLELPPTGGLPVSRALAINNLNEITGWSGTSGFSGTRIATLWPGTVSGVSLGIPAGGTQSVGLDINDEGTVLIEVSGGTEPGVVRLADGTVLTLPFPAGSVDRRLVPHINSAGDVCGAAVTADEATRLLLSWSRTPTGYDIGNSLSASIDSDSFNGTGTISDTGVIVWGFTDGGGGGVARRFDPRDAQLELVPRPGKPSSVIVNDSTESGAVSFLLSELNDDLSYVQYSDGSTSIVPALGCPPGFSNGCGDATGWQVFPFGVAALRSDGLGVGLSPRFLPDEFGATNESFAIIWTEAAGTLELSTFINDGSADGWHLEEATDINDIGVIVGNGINPLGEERGFILIPREPCAADTNRDGIVDPGDFSAWVAAYNSGCDPL